MPIQTTLNKIIENDPCEEGIDKLLAALGGLDTYGGDTPITFSAIAEHNDVNDAVWCLGTLDARHKVKVFAYITRRIERVLSLRGRNDLNERALLRIIKSYARGDITKRQLKEAGEQAHYPVFKKKDRLLRALIHLTNLNLGSALLFSTLSLPGNTRQAEDALHLADLEEIFG